MTDKYLLLAILKYITVLCVCSESSIYKELPEITTKTISYKSSRRVHVISITNSSHIRVVRRVPVVSMVTVTSTCMFLNLDFSHCSQSQHGSSEVINALSSNSLDVSLLYDSDRTANSSRFCKRPKLR